MSRKVIKKIMTVMITMVLMTGLAACGGVQEPNLR